jgi:hypothetical protein
VSRRLELIREARREMRAAELPPCPACGRARDDHTDTCDTIEAAMQRVGKLYVRAMTDVARAFTKAMTKP